jgi:hypothetical protein
MLRYISDGLLVHTYEQAVRMSRITTSLLVHTYEQAVRMSRITTSSLTPVIGTMFATLLLT